MANIIEVVNQIGNEVEQALATNNANELFMQSILLYSLTENLLKYLVATKICWDESCTQVDKQDKGITYDVDFGDIRKKASEYKFSVAIDKSKSLKLVSDDLKRRLHTLRIERNDLIHALYLFEARNNEEFMKENVVKIKAIVEELISVFENLIYEEIGVDIPEVLETL